MLVTIHGLAVWVIRMSLKAKFHASALRVAMQTGGKGRFLRKCLPLRLQFSRRLREFRGVTTGQAGFRVQGCLFQFDQSVLHCGIALRVGWVKALVHTLDQGLCERDNAVNLVCTRARCRCLNNDRRANGQGD
jgi:hypothetical protein